MIKNLLENEGIESQLTDEIIGSRAGAAWRTAGGVRIIVSDEFYEQAKMVVDEFEKSRKDNG
jgi:NADH:ubiquinone oxidoreductase subunit D